MSYNPATDFLALLRATSGGVRSEQMPGLDWWVAAAARAGLLTLVVGQTAPIVNQVTTAWFKPAVPSWSAEGQLYLWSAALAAYQPATPALWIAFLFPPVSAYAFQQVTNPASVITAGTSLLAVVRAAPATTTLILPGLAAQFSSGKKLQIVDFSTGVTDHTITLTVPDTATIMQQSTWNIQSSAAQLAGIMLQPCPDLNSWIIAP